jgi:hypothetical protein
MGILIAFLAITGRASKYKTTDIITSAFSCNWESVFDVKNVFPLHSLVSHKPASRARLGGES